MAERTSRTIQTVCPYCGVGCGLALRVEENHVVKVNGDTTHPANRGRLCAKGLTCAEALTAPGRLDAAFARADRAQPFSRTETTAAITLVAQRLRRIIDRHGPDAVAFYVSGQMSLEAQYLVNKLCKGFIGTNNIEANSRLCMSSAATGYTQSLGADGPPGSYQDIEHSQCFLVVGANMADCHPILFLRLLDQRQKTGAKIIVVDPRRTATAEKADLYLPIRPGTDLALLNGLLHLLARDGHVDHEFIRQHTQGWDELSALLEHYPPEQVTAITGIPEADLRQAARWIGEAPEWMSFWTMGLNQSTHGAWHTNALCNLHLATGKICRLGSGPFSLTGQPNAMGGREVGYLSHGLPGQRTVTNETDRRFMEALWRLQPGAIPAQPGPDAISLFRKLAEGAIKAVWIICTNPVASLPNRQQVIDGLTTAELVISQDVFFETETHRYADILLPGALWAEAEGVMVNSERTLTLMRKAVEPPGRALPDWQILAGVACEMGYTEAFAYENAAQVFAEIRQTWNPHTGYDLRGVDYARLRQEPVQWPCPPDAPARNPIRYRSGQNKQLRFPTDSGKAQFLARPYLPPDELPDAQYPFVLNTGRLPHQWHTLTKTGKIPALNKLNPAPLVELHPDDATRLGITNGETVVIRSRRGQARLPVVVTPRGQPGVCFTPFHWNDCFGEQLAINAVTHDAVDAASRQPELKYCAVRLEKEQSVSTAPRVTLASPSDTKLVSAPADYTPHVETLRAFLGLHESVPVQLKPEEKHYLSGFFTGVQLQPVQTFAQAPVVPDTAPFAPERRLWLNGVLAGVFSRAPVPTPVPPVEWETNRAPSPTVTILHASQTGNAESVARQCDQRLTAAGFSVKQLCMTEYQLAELSKDTTLLLITSTYGDGETPDAARTFWHELSQEAAPRLPHLRYAVLALGDANYAQFCQCGKNFDARLAELGAASLLPRVDCDVDFQEQAERWITDAMAVLCAGDAPPAGTVTSCSTTSITASIAPAHDRTQPFLASLLVNRRLNGPGSRKETRHYELSLAGSGLRYEAGDALGVWPTNCPDLVEEILMRLRLCGEAVVSIPGVGDRPLREALLRHYEIACLSTGMLQAMAERSGDAAFQQLLTSDHRADLRHFLWGRQFADLLEAYPRVHFTAAELTTLLRKLQPRLYSLSSSPKAHGDHAHLTVRTVRYTCAGRMRKGMSSTFLADRAETAPVPVFIQHSPAFHPPTDPTTAMIMIGPGTGIAPFRGFLSERRIIGATGRNWLFFGEQCAATDFYYQDELTAWRKDGLLTRLDVAFSRDQTEKIYVQHRLLQHGAELWGWLQDGAWLYVCGDASHMAKDVHAALEHIATRHGGLSEEHARMYLQQLASERRYLRDVY